MNYPIEAVTINLTEDCNLNCKHCGSFKNSAGELNLSQARQLQYHDFVRILNKAKELNVKYIIYSGGEPFLNKDIADILDYTETLKLKFIILTNGTLINKDKINYLKNYNNLLYIRISLDYPSNSKIYEFRGIHDGYTKLIRVINNLVYNDIHVGIGLTILRENLDEIEKLVGLSDKLGADFFRAVPIMPIGNAKKYNIDTAFYTNCIKLLLTVKKKYEKISYISNKDTVVIEDPDLIIKKLLINCTDGLKRFIISSYGNINFCPLLSYHLESPTYFNDSFNNLMVNVQKQTSDYISKISSLPNECKECQYLQLCNYGCIAEIYARINNSQISQVFCMKKIIHELLKDENKAKEYLNMINYVIKHMDLLKENNLFTNCYRCLPFWNVYLTS